MKLSKYIERGDWYNLFSENDRGHLLTFFYNLIAWLERDQADELIITPPKFHWRKQHQVVGEFPITTPEPSPSFRDMLIIIIERDVVIRQYIIPDSADESLFHIRNLTDLKSH